MVYYDGLGLVDDVDKQCVLNVEMNNRILYPLESKLECMAGKYAPNVFLILIFNVKENAFN